MRLVNLQGRAAVALDGGAVDLERRSNGRFGADPMQAVAAWDAVREWQRVCVPGTPTPPSTRPRSPAGAPSGEGIRGRMNYRAHAQEAGMDFELPRRSSTEISAASSGRARMWCCRPPTSTGRWSSQR